MTSIGGQTPSALYSLACQRTSVLEPGGVKACQEHLAASANGSWE
jgi:hypothetical protein